MDASGVKSSPSERRYFDRAQPVVHFARQWWQDPPIDGDEPSGWTRFIHPTGHVYWVHYHKHDGRIMPVYTFAHLGDQEIRKEVENFRDAILSGIDLRRMPHKWELALDLPEKSGLLDYYFIDCSNRTLFWIHNLPLRHVLYARFIALCPNPLFGPPSFNSYGSSTYDRATRLELGIFYWAHWEAFPGGRDIPKAVWKELAGIIANSGFNNMTSNALTSINSREEIQKTISHLERVRLHGGKGGEAAYVVGRLMRLFIQGGYVKPPSPHEECLHSDQSVYGNKDKPPLLAKSLSVWLNLIMGCVLMRQLLSGPS